VRVTHKTLSHNLLRNLNQGLSRLDKLNFQLSTGKTVNVPSDDPVKAGSIMRLRSAIKETEQYLRNADHALSWLEATDTVLQELNSVIHRAKDLALAGANGTQDDSARAALADEVAQLYDSVLKLANSTHAGRYLFAGQSTQKQPFVEGTAPSPSALPNIDFQGDTDALIYEIGVGARLQVNVNGEALFRPLFSAIQQLHGELTGGEPGSQSLDMLEGALDNVLSHLSHVGAKEKRLELASDRLKDLRLNVVNLLSESQDIDYAETIMNLKTEEFIYQTALAVGARIIQPSLVDFLR
jgi:flagellar hook-associated protein 3 FlgL